MHPAYFETHFDSHGFLGIWPVQFAIVTAWATTGTLKSMAANESANRELQFELEHRRLWHQKVTGYSPTTKHAEPGWAIELPFDDACELGQKFFQDAIYFIDADQLFVSHCDERRQKVFIGEFHQRLILMLVLTSLNAHYVTASAQVFRQLWRGEVWSLIGM